MTDVTGNPEEERRVDYYYQPWVTEGVCRWALTSTTHSFSLPSTNCHCTSLALTLPLHLPSPYHCTYPHPTLPNLTLCSYFYGKIQQKRAELDSSLGVRNS